MSLGCLYYFGEGDFTQLPLGGPFQVGHREFYSSKGNIVSAFYPISEAEYDSKISKNNRHWLLMGDKALEGFCNSAADYGSNLKLPKFAVKALTRVKLDVIENGTLEKDYSSG